MDGIRSRTTRFQHVVFADAINGARRAVDLASIAPTENETAIDVDDQAFLQWLFRLSGLDVRHYRNETLIRRLPACLRKLRVGNVALARAAITRNPQLAQEAMNAMLIGVSSFFRDSAVFDELAGHILPDLLRRGRPLRVWSAGCSDGQELYSIAMLLSELGAFLNAQSGGIEHGGAYYGGIELLGTDCRIDATRAAARGIYDSAALRGIALEKRTRHFEPIALNGRADRGQLWRVKAPLRAMVRWRTADLVTTVEPGPWDLILCRNAAIYLRPQAAIGLWQQLANAMARGGYLLLGKAERPLGTPSLSMAGHYLYRRTD